MGLEKRDYQQACVSNILDRRGAGIRRQLVVQATGTGKTITLGHLTYEMPKESQKIVVAHREELIDQAAEKIAAVNPSVSIGIEMGDRKADGREDVIVGCVATMKNPKRLAKFDPARCCWLNIDEAHHATASTYGTVIDHFMVNPHTTLVGYTATPDRSDGVALGSVFDEIVFKYVMLDAIRDGWLVDVNAFAVKTGVDINDVSKKFGDDEVSKAVDTFQRNELIVKNWIIHCWPRQTVVFTVNIQHAINIAEAFRRQGITAVAVWGGDPERARKLDAFRRGEITVLVNCQLLIEGFDMWQVECIIPATPTKSRSKLEQMVGRGTRLQEEIARSGFSMVVWRERGMLREDHKTHCLVMHPLDVTTKHSLATVPSLFGLPPKMDMQGQSVTTAAKKLAEMSIMYPQIDMNNLEELGSLESYVVGVNAFKVKFAEEVKGFSGLQWTKRGDDLYRLALPKNEYFTIREDMVGKFSIEGTLKGNTMKADRVASLAEAVGLVEKAVTEITPDSLKLLGREEKWMKRAISDDQMRTLKQLRVPDAVIATMNRGEATAYINSKFNRKGI